MSLHSQHTPSLFAELSGRFHKPAGPLAPRTPLVVALHGGTYTSAYFDVPGASLFEQAAALRIPLLAPERPGYLGSLSLPPVQMTVEGQARHLGRALQDAWQRHGAGTAGLFVIGHSIGGAITATLASQLAGGQAGFPLLGIALSGMCLNTPPEHKPMWEQLPDTPTVEMPPPVKDMMMFGPEGSHKPGLVRASDIANAPAPKAELVDIVSTWSGRAAEVLGRIDVPVHYRQAELDKLWVMSQTEVDGFSRALARSPRVDAAMVRGTGHCMDFHHVGRSLQLQQLAFALQCAAQHPTA
jgi:pimeloyl-ACP methyl ester carboxylesterase